MLQAHLTDVGPRGGSALKNLPWHIFAPSTSFSAFLLTPGVGNFPQPKKQTKGGKKGSREVHWCEQATDHNWAQARKWHKAAYFIGTGEGSTRFYKHHRVQEALSDLCHRAGAKTEGQELRWEKSR